MDGHDFNSEANFIRVSPEGAAKVKQKRLTLDDLSPAYLEAVFDTPHREVVADLIEKCCGVAREEAQVRVL